MELLLKLIWGVLGKTFNDTSLPWYYNALPALLIFIGIIVLVFLIRAIKNKKKA